MATRRDIEDIFGIDNVRMWADLDKSNDQALVQRRVDYHLANALEYLYSRLRRRYDIPFANPPRVFVWLNALYAGICLYDARLIVATDTPVDQVSRHKKEFRRVLRQILNGQLYLTDNLSGDEIVSRGISIPFGSAEFSSVTANNQNCCDQDCCCQACYQTPCVCIPFAEFARS